MNRRNILLRLEYCGTGFAGWQVQAGQRTVQGVVAENLQKFLGEKINLVGAGRTDSGVHALAQYANFTTTRKINPATVRMKLSRMLPDDVVVTGCRLVETEFDSRRDATGRSYRYLISERLSAIRSEFAWILGRRLDLSSLNLMAKTISQSTHFDNFCKTKSLKSFNECRIFESWWARRDGYLRFQITANRFLHNMVRLLVGTMVAVADARMEISTFRKLLQNKVNEKTKHIAPGKGLYLVGVHYGEIKS